MGEQKKELHLICNAHLDPVWLWNLEEGISAALSTFRTAAEFCETYDGFVFNHNEVLLYQWIEEYEPELFRKIQRLVREGKWHIMGGWFLQPDCNMPSGESFIRQIRSGRRYFQEKFGVTPETAINFDPFGHSRGLVQILKKAGYHSYLFCRPSNGDCPLPDDDFIWVGFDGSEILAHRASESYNSLMGEAGKKVNNKLKELSEKSPEKNTAILLWGVGNHGGGPSRQDLRDLKDIMEREQEWKISHSIPEAYFSQLKEKGAALEKVSRDLNPWAVGCYTSQIRIKQGHRRLEGELTMAEKMLSQASMQGLLTYPEKELGEAEYSLMLSEFHDILPGSSIRSVEEQALRFLGHGTEIAERMKRRAFFALLSGEERAAEGEYPILAYNPHPWPVEGIFTCEFQLRDQNWSETFARPVLYRNGERLNSQVEKEECNMNLDWRKRVVFETVLPPSSMTRISCYIEWEEKPKALEPLSGEDFVFRGDALELTVSRRTGLITSWKVDGKEYLSGPAGRLKVLESDKDPWGMNRKGYQEAAGYFALLSKEEGTAYSGSAKEIESVRVIEDGPVRTVVEAVFGYHNSRACIQYALPKHGTAVEISCTVEWAEKGKFLKMEIPTVLTEGKALSETAYGVQEYPSDGLEKVGHRWNGLFDEVKDAAMTVINDGTYAMDFYRGTMGISMLHSAAYAAHPIGDRSLLRDDRYLPYIDQGERRFHFVVEAGSAAKRLERIGSEAVIRQEAPMIVPAFPSGEGEKPLPSVSISDPAVVLAAFHKSSEDESYVIRLYETTGKMRSVHIELPVLGFETELTMSGHEIRTCRIHPSEESFGECSILL